MTSAKMFDVNSKRPPASTSEDVTFCLDASLHAFTVILDRLRCKRVVLGEAEAKYVADFFGLQDLIKELELSEEPDTKIDYDDYIMLYVGGTILKTTRATLTTATVAESRIVKMFRPGSKSAVNCFSEV